MSQHQIGVLYKGSVSPPDASQGDLFSDQTTNVLYIHNGVFFSPLINLGTTITGQLALPVQGTSGGILFGGDTLLYRSAPDMLSTGAGDGLTVQGTLVSGTVNGQTISSGALFTGSVTVANGLTVTAGGFVVTLGGAGIVGGLNLTGNLTMLTAASRIVPGATSFAIRDNSNSVDNLVITNAGNATLAGGLTMTFGNLTFLTANSRIIPGATSLVFRDTANAATNMTLTDGGILLVGAITTNAKMTTGLTLAQGGADNEILALKSSDVAHGFTAATETDTFGTLAKAGAATGGLAVTGYASNDVGLSLKAEVVTPSTTKSTSATAPVMLTALERSGAGPSDTNLAGSENVFCINNGLQTRFIFEAAGNSYEDVGTAWTNFDDHDDIALLTEISRAVSKPADPIHAAFRDWADADRARIQALDLVHFNEDGHHFANRSKIQMLLIGAVRQQAAKLDAQAREIAALTQHLALREA